MATQKILLSGVKPTGAPHIGNYFGALRQFVVLQEQYRSFFMIADYHALTSSHLQRHPEKLTDYIYEIAATYLAIGLNPEKVTIFQQSQVPEHTELTWTFNCLTTMPYLMRAHAFKDAEAKDKEINVGTFDYPMLMAADILFYGADVVPVGKDQKQHIEFARDTAEKFNHLYSDTFRLPEALILESVATVPGIDGQKMSKSYNNTIPLFAEKDEIQKLVMSIVTDSTGTRPENVYAIHKLVKDPDELDTLYKENEGNYRVLKETLVEDLETFIAPMRARFNALMKNKDEIRRILDDGSAAAREITSVKMAEVRKKIGVR